MSQTLKIQQALEKYGKVIQTIKGDSMLPLLNEDKDAVELVPVKGELKKYDLPLYQRPNGKMVLHRIIEVKKHYYMTCGDNRTNIEKVPKEWVVAVAAGFYKDGRYVSCQDESYITYVHRQWENFPDRKIVTKPRNEWKVIMALLRMAITGREEEIKTPGILLWDAVYNYCKNQKIGAAVCSALEKVDCPDQIKEKFSQLYQKSLHRSLLFQAEREKIYSALEEQNIPYMPLNGILYAPLYPAAGMRESADNDILIRPQNAQTAKHCMTEMGYRCKPGGDSDFYQKEPMLKFELHTRLFFDVWNCAVQIKKDGCQFLMSDEDVYLHTVAHFHKTYTESGCGLRPFADLYLLRKQGKSYDMQYIDRKLDEMGLREFAAFFEETTQQLFDADADAIPYETVQYIFESDAYNNDENRAKSAIAKDGAGRYLRKRVFPPYSDMCMRHPCLTRLPFLLPVFWIVRLVEPVFSAKKWRRFKVQLVAIVKSKKKNG